MSSDNKSPVPRVAKELAAKENWRDQPVQLGSGIKAKIKPVPTQLIDNINARIKDPKPPKQYVKEKDREEENPLDPAYLKALEEAVLARGRATTEAMIMFGIELVEDIPDESIWLPKLKFLEKRGYLDLEEYDLEDEMEREFVYKCFVAVSNDDLMKVMRVSGLSGEEVEEAMAGFPGGETREPNPELPAKG